MYNSNFSVSVSHASYNCGGHLCCDEHNHGYIGSPCLFHTSGFLVCCHSNVPRKKVCSGSIPKLYHPREPPFCVLDNVYSFVSEYTISCSAAVCTWSSCFLECSNNDIGLSVSVCLPRPTLPLSSQLLGG